MKSLIDYLYGFYMNPLLNRKPTELFHPAQAGNSAFSVYMS